jgi:hypothetical protein
VASAYFMYIENDTVDYIGNVEPNKTEPYEITFYISLVILLIFYISILSKRLLKIPK